MEENPYKSPEDKESVRQLNHNKRFKISLLEKLAFVCWVVTIVVAGLGPRAQSTRILSDEQRVRNERYDSNVNYAIGSTIAVSGALTLVLIVNVIRRRK